MHEVLPSPSLFKKREEHLLKPLVILRLFIAIKPEFVLKFSLYHSQPPAHFLKCGDSLIEMLRPMSGR
jgi:hypothetical protein